MLSIKAFLIGLICYGGFCHGRNCLSGCYMPQPGLLHEQEHQKYCDKLRQTQECLSNRYMYCRDNEKALVEPQLIDFQARKLALCEPNYSTLTGQECLNENAANAREYTDHCSDIVNRYALENPRNTAEETLCLTMEAKMNCMAMHIKQRCGHQAAWVYKNAFQINMGNDQIRICKAYGFF